MSLPEKINVSATLSVITSGPQSYAMVAGLRDVTCFVKAEQQLRGLSCLAGDKGDPSTITIGTTTTLPAGSSATVENVGTESDAILNFGIPKGADGTGADPAWGNITGDIDNQTDLSNALDAKADTADLGDLASLDSIDYTSNYLTNKPTLGTMAAVNDAGSDNKTYGRKNGSWVEVTGGGGGGSAEWGDITGTLSDQTDLQAALDNKADVINTNGSGAVVSIQNAPALPVNSLKVGVEPVQTGSGDPSSSNVRPIIGWTGINLQRSGTNYLNNAVTAGTYNGLVVSVDANKIITFSGTPTGYSAISLGNTSVANLSGSLVLSGLSHLSNIRWDNVKIYDSNSTLLDTLSINSSSNYTFTLPSGASYIQVVIKRNSNVATFGKAYLVLSKAEAVNTQISLSSAGTVYGGTLNVTTGTLTVTHGLVTFDGSDDESWTQSTSGTTYRYYTVISDAYSVNATRSEVSANEGKYITSGSAVGGIFIYGGSGNAQCYYIPPQTCTTVAEFKTWLSSNNLQVVYKLATPVTYTLTPAELTMLLGDNVIWADTGAVTVGYKADTKTYVDTKAPLDSPALTGTPTAPTPSDYDDSTKIATTRFVNTAINNRFNQKVMYYTGQTVSAATSAQIMRIPASGSNGSIRTDTVVVSCVFANPANIASNVSWQTYSGYVTFTGTCTAATTADVIIIARL